MQQPNQYYLTVDQVAERLGVSRDTIYRWKREGLFPKARRLGAGTTRWLLSDIEEWESHRETCFAMTLDEPVRLGS